MAEGGSGEGNDLKNNNIRAAASIWTRLQKISVKKFREFTVGAGCEMRLVIEAATWAPSVPRRDYALIDRAFITP
jgi:hypothetical protein